MYEVTEQKLQQSSLPVYKLLPRIQLQLEHHQTIPLETSSQSILIFWKLPINLRTFMVKAAVVPRSKPI